MATKRKYVLRVKKPRRNEARDLEIATSLNETGASYTEAAKKYDTPRQNIHRIARNHGITRPKSGEWASNKRNAAMRQKAHMDDIASSMGALVQARIGGMSWQSIDKFYGLGNGVAQHRVLKVRPDLAGLRADRGPNIGSGYDLRTNFVAYWTQNTETRGGFRSIMKRVLTFLPADMPQDMREETMQDVAVAILENPQDAENIKAIVTRLLSKQRSKFYAREFISIDQPMPGTEDFRLIDVLRSSECDYSIEELLDEMTDARQADAEWFGATA